MTVTVATLNAGTTIDGRARDIWGTRTVGLFQVTMDSSYTSGGEAFDPRSYGFDKPVAGVFLSPRYVAAAVGATFQYDHANKKILSFCGADESGAVNLSTVVLDVIVVSE